MVFKSIMSNFAFLWIVFACIELQTSPVIGSTKYKWKNHWAMTIYFHKRETMAMKSYALNVYKLFKYSLKGLNILICCKMKTTNIHMPLPKNSNYSS